MTNSQPSWLPEGRLGSHVTTEVAQGLIRLARSTDPNDTDMLMHIAMTQGLRHPRFAIDAIAVERDRRHAQDSIRLQRVLVLVSVLAVLASAAQVLAAFVR